MRMKNLRKGLNSAIAIALVAGMTLSSSGGGAVYDAGYVSERISNNHSKISAKYTFKEYAGEEILCVLADAVHGDAAGKLTGEARLGCLAGADEGR